MKKNPIPLDKSSNYNSRYPRDSNRISSNYSINNRISYDVPSNIYVQNEYNPFKKYSNEFIVLKTRELYPSMNAQSYRNDYYDRQTYNNDRYSDSNYNNKEYLQTSVNKQYINKKKIFNGNQNTKWIVNNYYENNNDMEKNRENYTYYESKYSRKTNNEINYLNYNKVNEQNIIYSNENYNYSNISLNKKSLKKSHYYSNSNINNKLENSEFKKRNRVIFPKIENEKSNIKNKNIINAKINNQYNYPSSSSVHLDINKDNYHSPEKNKKIGTNLYDSHDNNRIGKKLSSKSSDKIQIKKEANINNKNDNKNKNKKLEIIKMYKSNMIELKKPTNSTIKKIPISPKGKNMKSSINETSINVNKEKHQIKNNFSYSEVKPKESRRIFQAGYSEIKEKKNFSLFKGLKLTNNKRFKKSITYNLDKELNYKKFERANSLNDKTRISTIKIGSKLLDNDDNNKIINISHSKYKDNEENTDKRHNLFLNKLKKGKSGAINDNKSDGKLLRRLYSHQKLNIYPEFKRENLKAESSKILNTIINNLNNSNILENSQRLTNDNLLNKKKKYDNYTNKNNSILNINTLNKYNKYNINTEIKKSIKNKGSNIVHTITSNKIKTPKLENNYHSILDLKKSNLVGVLKTPMKSQNQTRTYLKNKENDEEENWDDNEFLGLGKKTYDIGQRQIKNKIKKHKPNLVKKTEKLAQPSFIKFFESLSIPGKNDNGNKKINQDSYIMERNINGISNFNIFGVLDGHGENGHHASQFVSRYIINYIKNNPLIKKCRNAKEVYEKLKYNGYELIAYLYMDADEQIAKEKFDCKNSGTTCVIVIQLEEKIICANAGDSRAIIIYDKIKNDNLTNSRIYPLSYDCKPNLPNEKKRIYEHGGTVRKAFDDYNEEGPFRVFEKEDEYPGLAISRSIGDIDAKKLGVIPNPQIVEYKIDYDSKYLLICSDGIWEFISNEDAMKIGNKFYLKNDAKGLCQELYKKSLDFWLQEDVSVDDITVVAVFF